VYVGSILLYFGFFVLVWLILLFLLSVPVQVIAWRTISKMNYNVSSGMLNLTHSFSQSQMSLVVFGQRVMLYKRLNCIVIHATISECWWYTKAGVIWQHLHGCLLSPVTWPRRCWWHRWTSIYVCRLSYFQTHCWNIGKLFVLPAHQACLRLFTVNTVYKLLAFIDAPSDVFCTCDVVKYVEELKVKQLRADCSMLRLTRGFTNHGLTFNARFSTT